MTASVSLGSLVLWANVKEFGVWGVKGILLPMLLLRGAGGAPHRPSGLGQPRRALPRRPRPQGKPWRYKPCRMRGRNLHGCPSYRSFLTFSPGIQEKAQAFFCKWYRQNLLRKERNYAGQRWDLRCRWELSQICDSELPFKSRNYSIVWRGSQIEKGRKNRER